MRKCLLWKVKGLQQGSSCRQWGHCLLTWSLPQCKGGPQQHPEARVEVGASEAHDEQPAGGEATALHY